ncbi:hypothetical protein [Streptomyces venezuelae]|uniref:hypothetical protein n=1 Tax=Streptomyces venezuelae TaxID=54571 RepID=UPI0036477950
MRSRHTRSVPQERDREERRSIYHHIKGKAALLDAMSEAVLGEAFVGADEVALGADEDASRHWEDIARRTAHRYRDMAYRHPRPRSTPPRIRAWPRSLP